MRDALHPFVYPTIFAADISRGRLDQHARRTRSTSTSTASPGSPAQNGARGYWTEGLHKDPKTGQDRYATPYDPISYGGGRVGGGSDSSFMHNAYHMPTALGNEAAGDIDADHQRVQQHQLRHRRPVRHLLAARHARRHGHPDLREPHAAPRRLPHGRQAGRVPRHGRHHDGRRLLGALVHGQGQHRRARQLRAGHALPRHLGPDQPAAGRLVPRSGPGRGRRRPARRRSSPATPPAPTGTASTSTSPTTSAASTSSRSTTP